MAGGTQIIISPEGITVKTVGYAKFFAADHIFEGGEQVPLPQFCLPTPPTDFSNKINYDWEPPGEKDKEFFVIDDSNGRLIAQNNNQVDDNKKVTSFRFYTPEKTDFSTLAFNSEATSLSQDNENFNNIDELVSDLTENEPDFNSDNTSIVDEDDQ